MDSGDVPIAFRHPELAGLRDEDVLGYAARERRIVVTRDLTDFPPLLRAWAEAGRSHAGCILVTLEHSEFGRILRRLDSLLERFPAQRDWVDRAQFL